MTSNISDLGIYVTTCDEMSFCLSTFCYLFNEFWPVRAEINVLGYEKPELELPENVVFHSLGKDRGAEYWTNDMIDFFSSWKKHEYFLMAPEDGFLIKPVDENLMNFALKVSKDVYSHDGTFLRFGLTHCVSSRPHRVLMNVGSSSVIISNYGTDYRHSLQHSIWNRENLLHILKPNMTPWQVELDETARYDNLTVLAYSGVAPIHVGHGYSKGKKIKNWYSDVWNRLNGYQGLDRERIQYVESKNWLPEIDSKVKRDGGGNII